MHDNENINVSDQEKYDESKQLHRVFEILLKDAFDTGDPAGELAKEACEMHKQWLCIFNPDYTEEYHIGFVEMCVADERFRANYEMIAPGCTEFFRDAIKEYFKI